MRKEFLLLLFLTRLSFSGLSQNFYFTQPKQALSQNTVNVISQDELGFLWVGTENGLNRYDGEKINIFLPDQQAQLGASNVTAISTDKKGLLWLGTIGGGLSLYDPYRQSFINDSLHPLFRSSLDKSLIQDIYESRDSVVWVATQTEGVKFWDRKDASTDQYFANGVEGRSLGGNNVQAIVEDKDGDIWFGIFGGGISQYHRNKQIISIYTHEKGYDLPADNIVRNICTGPSGLIWIATHSGLRAVDKSQSGKSRIINPLKTNARLKELLEGVIILSLLEDSKENLWIGTENSGLILWDRKNHKIRQFKTDIRNEYGIHSNSIWSLFEDRDGTIWIGGFKSGICKIDPKERKFNWVSEASGGGSSISRALISAFAEDSEGNLWIGSEGGGIDIMDPNGQIRNVSDEEFPGLTNKVIVSLVSGKEDEVYAASWGKGVFLKRKNTSQFIPLPFHQTRPVQIPFSNLTRNIYMNEKGHLWIANHSSGLNLYKPETEEMLSFYAGAGRNQIRSNAVNAILQSKENILWLGYANYGIDRVILDDEYNIVEIRNYSPQNPEISIPNNINYFFEDKDGMLWIGSNGSGLYKFDPIKESSEIVSMTDSLPGNSIYGILQDESSKIWVSTNNGLACLQNKRPYHIKSFDTSDGLQDKEFTASACLRRKDGTLVFGGINGFNYFKPDEISLNTNVYPLYITALELESLAPNSKEIQIERIEFPKGNIELAFDQNDLRFEFTQLNFTRTEKNVYSFMLKNLDEEWRKPTTDNFASYLNVPPGNYTFLLKAANNDGIENPHVLQLDLKIKNPWYSTYLAKILYVLLSLSLLIFIYYMLLNREKLKNQLNLEQLERNKVKELSLMKSRFFANISHEFKTPLTLIQSPLIELRQMKLLQPFGSHLDLIRKNTERLQKLIDEILDLSRIESGNIKLEKESREMGFFTRSILDYFSQYLEARKLSLHTHFPTEEIILNIDPDKIEKVLFNILSNAVKFTPEEGKIELGLYPEKDWLHIDIADTGQGIKSDQLAYVFDLYNTRNNPSDSIGTGIGLHLAKQYVELHGGKIKVESKEEKGSRFRISLPRESQELSTSLASLKNEQMKVLTEPLGKLVSLKEHRIDKKPDPLQKPIILIAEDNEEIRNFLCNILKEEYRIIACNNGSEAYEKSLLSIPDLILSDVIMPEMSGYDLCKKIRENEKTCHIIFFILSVKSEDNFLEKGLNIGVDQYLSKPFNPSHLKLMIKNAIQKRS
ncbi:MAG: two-component regulator propeller domain-containing protein, partial [Bacteroidota bacterium]